MSDAYEFECSFLEMETLSPLEFAHLAAGVEIGSCGSEEQGESFRPLPGCWLDPKTRSAINVRQRIDRLYERTTEATACRHVKTRKPREWIEWARESGIELDWLEHAYRDPRMLDYLPARGECRSDFQEQAIPQRDRFTETRKEERDESWFVEHVKVQFWGTAERENRSTWPTGDVIKKYLKDGFDLVEAQVKRIDVAARPMWAKRGGRPPSNAEKG